jgi:hypothetical protein
MWRVRMKKGRRLLMVAVLALLPNKAFATTPADPCQVSSVPKRSVPISVPGGAGETVTVLVPAFTQTIHVCGFTVSAAGFFFEYGSGSACGTGRTALAGVMTPSNSGWTAYSGPCTIFSVPANNGLGVDNSGESVNGVLTYTQPWTHERPSSVSPPIANYLRNFASYSVKNEDRW